MLSWSEGRAIKGIEDTGESINSMAERTAGFDDEIVAYAMSVRGGRSGSERGISVYRGRQNGSQSDSHTNLAPSSRASRDTDVASQGSDHSHPELSVGGSNRKIYALPLTVTLYSLWTQLPSVIFSTSICHFLNFHLLFSQLPSAILSTSICYFLNFHLLFSQLPSLDFSTPGGFGRPRTICYRAR